jgi:hypothetical protein
MAPQGELYIPLSVAFTRDPKVRAMVFEHGAEGMLAAYLYVLMVCYCREAQSDGYVPVAEITALAYPLDMPTAQRLASYLLAARLTTAYEGSRGSAHRVAAYVKWNGTRQDAARRSEQAKHAGRLRWAVQAAEGAGSGSVSSNRAVAVLKSETESDQTPISPVVDARPPARPRAREAEPEREIDLPGIAIQELRDATGGLVIGRGRAAELVAEIIGDRKLTSPAAYLRRSVRDHPDPFALAGAPPAPPLPSTPPGRRRPADVPAAEAHRAASTVDGRTAAAPATDEQRRHHAEAARAALAAKSAGAVEDVPLPSEDQDPF